jgi:hypothetical protein
MRVSRRFDFRIHNASQLAASLARGIRRQWPNDAQRLRLSATYDSYGRFQMRYEQIEVDGRSHYLNRPMRPTGDFDDVSKVLADPWHFSGDNFRELTLEPDRSGDDYTLLRDGRAA